MLNIGRLVYRISNAVPF